ncbi:hypothetical protein A2U01_0057775, partial [Trifolium medium]|nr:hypothetical protein [Trifolium medium]
MRKVSSDWPLHNGSCYDEGLGIG